MADPSSKPEIVKPKPRWYDLDWLVPFRDLVLVLGFLTFVAGVFLLPRLGAPVGLMTLGAGLMYAAWRVLVRG